MKTKLLFTTALVFTALAIQAETPTAAPVETPLQSPYTTSSTIVPPEPSEEEFTWMKDLIFLPIRDERRERRLKKICSERRTEASGPRAALAILESSNAVELQFSKSAVGKKMPSPGFSMFIEFKQDSILLRSSQARYRSDEAGLDVPYPRDFTRDYWLEGKEGSDILIMIPEVSSCSMQSVLLCPRTFVPRATLATTAYAPTGVRYYPVAKADGLYAVGDKEPSITQAMVLASSNVDLPEKWKDRNKSITASAAVKVNTIKDPLVQPPGPFHQAKVPFADSVEARLEFGKEYELQRTSFVRTTIYVRELTIDQKKKTTIRGADLDIEQGACYLVTQVKDSVR